MKKWITALLALVLALTISAPALAAGEEFDPTVTVTQGTNSITGTLVSTDSNNAILAARKPALSVPCGSRTVVSVTSPNGGSLTFTQEDGLVRFTVEQGGAYVIALRPVSSGSNPSGGSSAPANPTVNTETTTTPDGSTVKTETKQDGTVVESTKSPDGSTTTTESKSETKADGSTVETKKETVTASDGSTTTTETRTETRADGTTTETKKTSAADGSTSTTTTTADENGSKTASSVSVSGKAVREAQKTGKAVTLPIEVSAGKGSDASPTVDVEIPAGSSNVTVEIPVSNVSSGTVVVIVHEDGTEDIVKTTGQTENGVQFTVSGSVTVKIMDNSQEFSDTKGHWSAEDVNYVAARGLFNGVGSGAFGMSEETTRGMVMTVLARLAGVDTSGGDNWYDKGAEWAKENGVSDGSDPNGTLTREQLAVMLYRFVGSPAVSGELSFSDADQVSDWAKDAVLWATQTGIIGGMGDGTLAPGGSAERAQVATMFARFLRLMA